jgi:hypothetical protein
MRLKLTQCICALGTAWLAASGLAIPNHENLKENYQSIIDRNPFGLKPIEQPKAPVTNEPPAQPKPKTTIYLTGITSVGYPRIPKYVFLKTVEEGNKKENYYTLQEDMSKDGISVLQIDDQNKRVKIRTGDGEKMLTFATDGIQPPAAPTPLPGAHPGAQTLPQLGVQPGVPQPVNNGFGQQGAAVINNIPQPINNYNPNTPTIPARNVRVANGNPGNPNYGGVPGAVNTPPSQNQQQPEVDPALQYLMLKAQAAHEAAQGLPVPPIPNLE